MSDMSPWDDKPNDYEHALALIECLETDIVRLRAEIVRLRAELVRLRAEEAVSDFNVEQLHAEVEQLRAELATERAARIAVASPVREEGEL